ncbi:ABC transporter ATP-binding protein [Listeria booriae]|uniref:ABC transporter ATP-binding protein n=1 Tax=Listeria booriae TaxID=1552123 RepID=UPI00162777AA|nr:ABC transporter ATP-binding protein [Listeria booriae]MBC1291254.1 ABC transporter ATP-binding protein [Listeria booriae]MBC1946132.1 ABC transporter ATP-binding protein [Listeria booriae]MBC2673876.1 ABC transporter ATP-binding protein [Listeria booriae]MBC6130064.1 ABC transporter ATP-binding protein [Listeria booriae]MBC6161901.1 ABC transporter ATP-binding protein [Listeria booriae]
MLQVNNVTKQFGDKLAVDDLHFQINAGEILGLIGQNGAGKTTTFRLILNFLKPNSGEILWDNKEITKINTDIIGYLPEERGLYPNVTIEDQIIFFAELKGFSRAKIKPEIDSWMERAEIVGKKTDLVKTLSKGNQQKIQLISTIIHRPKLVILDEPFSGLDPVNAEILKKFVFDLKEDGATIIFSSHRMENVDELCDSLVMLKRGKTVLRGKSEDVKNSFGRKRIMLDAPQPTEAIAALPGVIQVENHKGIRIVHLNEESDASTVFDFVTKDGFIPMFSLEPPTLEEIFKWKAGENNE